MVGNEPDEVDAWQAYVDDGDPPDREPRNGPDPFLVLGVALGVVILLGMILLRPTGVSRAQADDLAALGVPTDVSRWDDLQELADRTLDAYGQVRDNLELLTSDQLTVFTPDQTCAGHGKSGGCSH